MKPIKKKNISKFAVLFAAVVALVGISITSLAHNASAADVYYSPGSSGNISVGSNQSPKNLYALGQNVEVSANVSKDAVLLGHNVTIVGNTADDLLAAGINLEFNGTIGGSLRAVGNSVNINQPVSQDVVIASKDAHVLGNASIGGDILGVARNELRIDAPVAGNISFAGQTLYVNNTVGGSIYAKGTKLELGPNADIKGSVQYSSSMKLVMDQGSKVEGQVQHKASEGNAGSGKTIYTLLLAFIFALVLEIVGLFVLYAIFGKRMAESVRSLNSSYWKDLLAGFLLAILMPIAAIILLFTFVGIYLAVLLLVLWCLFLLLGWVIGIASFGSWLESLFRRKPQQVAYSSLIIGIVVASLIHLIPIVGFLFMLVITLAGTGAVASKFWHSNRDNRKDSDGIV